MSRLTKIFLSLMVLAATLSISYAAVAERRDADGTRDGFGMEISLDGRRPPAENVLGVKPSG